MPYGQFQKVSNMNESTMADREILLRAIELWLQIQKQQEKERDKQQKQSTWVFR